MQNIYQFKFSHQNISFNKKCHLYQNNRRSFYIYNDKLFKYHYDVDSKSLVELWSTSLPENINNSSDIVYFSTSWLPENQTFTILKTAQGINCYQHKENELIRFIKSDNFEENIFHDVFDWNESGNSIQFGYFYPDPSLLGIITQHKKYGLKFYAVMPDAFLVGNNPIWPLNTNNDILNKTVEVYLIRNGQENIVVRDRKGLNIYKFNQHYKLEHKMFFSVAKHDDFEEKIFFPHLTNQSQNDIVLVNRSGLFLYQFNGEYNTYIFKNYNSFFAEVNGWGAEYINTIQFEDLDFDGNQDMIFTGPEGINVLSYDKFTNIWLPLVDNSDLTIAQHHSTLSAIISSVDIPIIFTQYKNELFWANFIESKELPTYDILESKIFNETPSEFIPQLQNALDKEKPISLLRDQLDFSSVINAVDRNTGRLQFVLPIVDLSVFSNNFKIDLIYDEDSPTGILGLGWSMPENFIILDHHSSIFPEDEKYYLILQDFPHLLIIDSKNSNETISYFTVKQKPHTKICYFKNDERWEIIDSELKQIYGSKSANVESINWELIWVNWRGIGEDLIGQKRLASKWYLTQTEDAKHTIIHYKYDAFKHTIADRKTFREIYLKSITNKRGSTVTLNHSYCDEYKSPLKEEDNLKTKTKYFDSFNVTTPTYKQNINLIYNKQNDKRLLIEVRQELDPTNRPVIRFVYRKVLNSYAIETVFLPTNLRVQFTSETIKNELDIIEIRCDVPKVYRVDFMNDVLVSYIDPNGQVLLKMFSEENFSYSVTSTLLGRGFVKHHEVFHTQHFMAIILYYNFDKELCLFREIWNISPKCYKYKQDVTVKFGVDFIIAHTNSLVTIIFWDKEIKLKSIVTKVLLVATSRRIFIYYDDEYIRIGYRNTKGGWQIKIIKKIPTIIRNLENLLTKFELNDGVHKQLLHYFKDVALQLQNNLIVLNTFEVHRMEAYLIVHVFVLNSEYNIVKSQKFVVLQDTLNSTLHEIEDDSKNKFKLSYKMENNSFKVDIISFTGPMLTDKNFKKEKALMDIEKFKNEFTYETNLTKVKTIDEIERKKSQDLIELDWAKENIATQVAKLKEYEFASIDKQAEYLSKEAEINNLVDQIQEAKNKVQSKLNDEEQKALIENEFKRKDINKNAKYATNRINEQAQHDLDQLNKIAREKTAKIHQETEEAALKFSNLVTDSVGKSLFLLDITKYSVILNSRVAVSKNQKFIFTGDSWKMETLKETTNEPNDSVLLGDKFILSKENKQSPFKLFRQGNNKEKIGSSQLDLGVNQLNEISIQYPVYLAYQSKGEPVKVVQFLNDGEFDRVYELPTEEKLAISSNYQVLVTIVDSFNIDGNVTLIFRPQIGRLLPKAVVTRRAVYFDGVQKRFTGYEYAVPTVLGKTIYYGNTTLIPGNDKTSFGWIEEIKDFKNGTAIEEHRYNSHGTKIKTVKVTEEPAKNNYTTQHENPESVLFDKSGQLIIAQFSPHTIANEEIGYYGFEDYEPNEIGSSSKWNFHERDIVKQNYSFTGQNYLRLSDHNLEGTFQPDNQNVEYLASCWIRTQNHQLKLGDITPNLRAVVISEDGREVFGLLSEVKFKSGEWSYLEVIVDFLFAHKVYEGLNSSNSTENTMVKLKTVIYIGAEVNNVVEVDHVRFAPLNTDILVNVYHKIREPKEVIHPNGLVKRYVYNKYQELVAEINEYGQLEKIDIHSKSLSTRLKCNILIEPQSGFYEDFAPSIFYERWEVNDSTVWQINPGSLQHKTDDVHNLKINSFDVNPTSYGIKLNLALQSENSSIVFNGIKILREKLAKVEILGQQWSIPTESELLLIVEQVRMFVFIDGNLIFDKKASHLVTPLLSFEISGDVEISEVMIFNEPSVQITYFNALNEKIQEVRLENADTAIVVEYLYDELGRQAITTKPTRLVRSSNESVLDYYSNFIENDDPYCEKSVWKTGKLEGLIGKDSYSRIKYGDKIVGGLPSEEFSITGPYAQHFTSTTNNIIIKNLFPKTNYTYKVTTNPGIESTSVFDIKGNNIAWYFSPQGGKALLSTYEYNNNDKLVTILPPLYHEKVKTLQKLKFEYTSEEGNLFSTHISYDKDGKLLSKITPDSGKIEHIYTTSGLLKFILYHSQVKGGKIESVTYFEHDNKNRLIRTGKLNNNPTSKMILSNLNITRNNSEEYQQFYYSDTEREPALRGKLKRIITYNDNEPLIEETIFNFNQETISKRIIIPNNNSSSLVAINKRYNAGKLTEIEYPIDFQGHPLRIAYTYNKLGKIVEIGIPDFNLLANFSYNALGQIASEQFLPRSKSSFVRKYSYNAPGFLTTVEDKYLQETIYYTNGSYDGNNYTDGTITRTEFKATWHDHCDASKLGLNKSSFISTNIRPEISELCFLQLKKTGYLNERNLQTKVLYSEPNLPILCTYGVQERQIKKRLGEMGFPSAYGHSYSYGNYQELIAAKYFIGNDKPVTLKPDTFSREIVGINNSSSYDIWNILKIYKYILNTNENLCKEGKSLIKSKLSEDLKSINVEHTKFILPIKRLLHNVYYQKGNKEFIKTRFQKAFLNSVVSGSINQITNIVEMLDKNGYFQNHLTEELNNILQEYKHFLPDIVRVLSEHFSKQLGEAEFDVESYNIDANGNHKHFYTGFSRYKLNYNTNTNQIKNVEFKSYDSSEPERTFPVKHDSKGNVVQALHKGIQQIDYVPVSNRAAKIVLTDGRSLIFYYDAQGERILKRVYNNEKQITKEIHYIRDEFGRSLVEKQIVYISPILPPDVIITAYIYGPRGLLGFIRNDIFYSVFTDHENSIRLVIKNNEVVNVFDYLPYGEIMRQYNINPLAQISYRYTGQEYDEETQLYNYHARLYDPTIGRFYQIDPKNQYFSPYKYAGNSPVRFVDPDGEFAFLAAIVIFGLSGAYLGGAAANRNWNPVRWRYNDGRTWFGVLGGGIGGALLPVGFSASVGAFSSGFSAAGLSSTGMLASVSSAKLSAISVTTGLGVGASYLSTAATNGEWDMSKWNFNSPETYSSLLQGFSIGSGAAGGFKSAGTFYKTLSSSWTKHAFVVGSITTGTGMFTVNGFASNWDFSKPGVYMGFVDAMTGASDVPMFLHSSGRFLYKNTRNIKTHFRSFISEGFRGQGKYLGGTIFSNERQVLDKSEALSRLFEKQTWINTGTYLNDLRKHKYIQSIGNIFGAAIVAGTSGYIAINDESSAYTYYEIINGILIGGQLASGGKTVFKNKAIKRKINTANNMEQQAQNYAKQTLLIYKEIIESGKVFGEVDLDVVKASENTLNAFKRVSEEPKKIKIAEEVISIYKELSGKTQHKNLVHRNEVLETYLNRRDNLHSEIIEDILRICREKFFSPEFVHTDLNPNLNTPTGSQIDTAAKHAVDVYRQQISQDFTKIEFVQEIVNIYKDQFGKGNTNIRFDTKGVLDIYNSKHTPHLDVLDVVLHLCRRNFITSDSLSRLYPTITGDKPISYSPLTNERLKNKKIPNSDISVAVTSRFAVVTVSGTQTPGIVLYIDRKTRSWKEKPLTFNKKIEGEPVRLNSEIMSAIDTTKYELKLSNVETFEKKRYQVDNLIKDELKKCGIEEKISKRVSDLVFEKLKSELNSDDDNKNYILLVINKEKRIQKILTNILDAEGLSKENLLKPLYKSIGQIKQQKGLKTNSELQHLRHKLKQIDEIYTTLSKKLLQTTNLDNFEVFPGWKPNNCAEPNALHSLSKLNMGLEDIKFLATYKIPNSIPSRAQKIYDPTSYPKWFPKYPGFPDLTPHERCRYCKITTYAVKNTITDPAWQKIIDNFQERHRILSERFEVNKQTLYFLAPHYDVVNRLAPISTNDDIDSRNMTRKKRSASYKWSKIGLETKHIKTPNSRWNMGKHSCKKIDFFNSNKHIEIQNTRFVEHKKPTNSQIENWFIKVGWAKNALSKLFAPKRSLPETNSQSTTLQVGTIDINGTILLIDLFIRKITGERYIVPTEKSLTFLEAQGHALNITDNFELILKATAKKCGVILKHIDYHDLYLKVSDKIRKEKYFQIPQVLHEATIDAYPVDQNEKFLNCLLKNIEKLDDESLC